MNLFSRIAEILDSQLDDSMEIVGQDRLTEILEHMQDCLAALKETTALAMAVRWRIRRELAMHRASAAQWAQRAHAALRTGDHAKANHARAQQNEHEKLLR